MRGPHSRLNYRRLRSFFLFLFLTLSVCAQEQTHILSIVDAEDNPLFGVEVFNKDFTLTEVSDIDGLVIITNQFKEQTITLRYLGFETVEMVWLASDTRVQLLQKANILDEVILIGRTDARAEDLPFQIETVSKKEMKLMNTRNAADILGQHAEVFVQKSQMGGGSPVIRGFEANKVLLVVDGVRMNNAIYRSGHLQNAITLDQASLERAEVIYGPGSLMYGSDALGGVVHYRTQEPNFAFQKNQRVEGEAFLRYGSANNERSAHFKLNYGKKRWASLTSVSYSQFGDLRAGSWMSSDYPEFGLLKEHVVQVDGRDSIIDNPNPFIQIGTGYNQIDALQKFKFAVNDQITWWANFQLSNSSNIPRYDQLSLYDNGQLEFAEWDYGPQIRMLASSKVRWRPSKLSWFDEMIWIHSWQRVQEERIVRKFQAELRENNTERLRIQLSTIDFKKNYGRQHGIAYGMNVGLNVVQSEAYRENINTEELQFDLFTRYPDGGSATNELGSYLQYEYKTRDSVLRVHTGIRYSVHRLNLLYDSTGIFNWPDEYYEGLDNFNQSVTGSLGLNYKPSPSWRIRLLTATAYRAPNVDDIAKFRVKNDEVSVPNLDLAPERSWNSEISIGYSPKNQGNISITGFYTYLTQAIVRENYALPDGSTFLVNDGDTLTVVANINAEEARIMGLSLNVKYPILEDLKFQASANFIRGDILEDGKAVRPLAHIPPIYGRFGLLYEKDKWSFKLQAPYNSQKDIERYGGSTDNPEYATPEGALSWMVLNCYAGYSISERFDLNLGVENVFDKHYRPFSSGVSAPGIHFLVSLQGTF